MHHLLGVGPRVDSDNVLGESSLARLRIAFCEDRLTFFILARLLSADDNLRVIIINLHVSSPLPFPTLRPQLQVCNFFLLINSSSQPTLVHRLLAAF